MTADIGATIAARPGSTAERMRELRRTFHRRPELAFEEIETARTVMAELDRLGIPYEYGGKGGGVVGHLAGPGSGPRIALRAEMDALPCTEATGLPCRLGYAGPHARLRSRCPHGDRARRGGAPGRRPPARLGRVRVPAGRGTGQRRAGHGGGRCTRRGRRDLRRPRHDAAQGRRDHGRRRDHHRPFGPLRHRSAWRERARRATARSHRCCGRHRFPHHRDSVTGLAPCKPGLAVGGHHRLRSRRHGGEHHRRARRARRNHPHHPARHARRDHRRTAPGRTIARRPVSGTDRRHPRRELPGRGQLAAGSHRCDRRRAGRRLGGRHRRAGAPEHGRGGLLLFPAGRAGVLRPLRRKRGRPLHPAPPSPLRRGRRRARHRRPLLRGARSAARSPETSRDAAAGGKTALASPQPRSTGGRHPARRPGGAGGLRGSGYRSPPGPGWTHASPRPSPTCRPSTPPV